jgi:hypothetical protein
MFPLRLSGSAGSRSLLEEEKVSKNSTVGQHYTYYPRRGRPGHILQRPSFGFK